MKDKTLKALFFLCALGVITISGWLCDDAYHGLVMAKHFADGNGLVYNIGERVNASTCPLFTLIIAVIYSWLGRGMYFITMGICLLFSAVCIWLMIYKVCRDKTDLLFFCLIFCSKSFISYTTSGLENSLLFLLGIFFFMRLFKNNITSTVGSNTELFTLSFLAGLIALTRMDNILIYLPVLVYIFFVRRNKVGRIQTIFIGFAGVLLFIAWEIFSLFYYGFLFPNTAYIKLNTGISSIQYIMKGLQHIVYNLLTDPAVVIFPVIYGIAGLKSDDMRHKLLSAGILLYIAYIIRIGGDFMGGRHFTVIYLLSAAGLISLRSRINIRSLLKVAFVCTMFAVTLGVNIFNTNYLHRTGGTLDERLFYFGKTSLMSNIVSWYKHGRFHVFEQWDNSKIDEIKEAGIKRAIIINGVGGITAYKYSDLYLTDQFGLADPLLSHLPSKPVYGVKWRVGHMVRAIPEGYAESVRNNTNEITNPSLHEYYDVIRLITRGELFSPERIRAIIDMNIGRYDYLITQYLHDTQKNEAE